VTLVEIRTDGRSSASGRVSSLGCFLMTGAPWTASPVGISDSSAAVSDSSAMVRFGGRSQRARTGSTENTSSSSATKHCSQGLS